ELVVQLAGKRLALGFLSLQVATREPAIVEQQRLEPLLGLTAAGELGTGVAIAAPREPRESGSQHQQYGGQLVELQVLPASRVVEDRLVQLHPNADERSRERDNEDDRQVAQQGPADRIALRARGSQ